MTTVVDIYLQQFMDFCLHEKNFSKNSLTAYHTDITQFLRFVSIYHPQSEFPRQIETPIIDDFLEHLMDEKLESTTIARKVASLRTLFKYFLHKGLMDHNPTKKVLAPVVERFRGVKILSNDEIKRLLSFPVIHWRAARDKAILETLYFTGIKVNELCALKLEVVAAELPHLQLSIYGPRYRILEIPKRLKDSFNTYTARSLTARWVPKQGDGTDALFINKFGGPLTVRSISRLVEARGKQAKLGFHLCPGFLRHTYAVHELRDGLKLEVLRKRMGLVNTGDIALYRKLL